MLPVVIYENSVSLFNFYHDGLMQQGMSHRAKLYKLVKAFDTVHRSQAYVVGCHLSNRGGETVITVSQQHYKVWVDVRCATTLEADFLENETFAVQRLPIATMTAC